MTTTDRLTEIEARLAAATPGPWEARDGLYDGKYVVGPREAGDIAKGPIQLFSPTFWTKRSARNAELIAAAPADLAALVAVVREVEEIHRRVRLSDGRWICAICPTVTPSGALVPTLYPCPTVVAVQKLGDVG